jgi:MoaA/NifB/PqqE/SkfB family radical SAM enzyme
MGFPQSVSFTLTNTCNLRCKMCGQWSEEGYMHGGKGAPKPKMGLADWKRLVDELAAHNVGAVLLRGGEPFLFPQIIELLEYITQRGLFVPMDTNGTQLEKYAADIVRIGKIHLTISVDGPEEIHDEVRGVKGCFKKLRDGVAKLNELEKQTGTEISKAICFVISPYSVKGLGEMPDVARSLSIKTIAIVPYYYVTEKMGREYENVMKEKLGCPAFSWCGFHHENSGVDFNEFREQYKKYQANLNGITSFPYMPFSEDDYRGWFTESSTPVGLQRCRNPEKLLDIQPGGEANFCIDFPDYSIGNVLESTIESVWNGERAEAFRRYRQATPLPVCYRCGARYMSEM